MGQFGDCLGKIFNCICCQLFWMFDGFRIIMLSPELGLMEHGRPPNGPQHKRRKFGFSMFRW